MTGGIIQLVAHSPHDVFLTLDPQITFFKCIYRRHTNFAIEATRQNFLHQVGFGKKATCPITINGDLVSDTFLVLSLPNINKICTNDFTKFAWVKKIGFAIIKMVEIEIGGFLIDRQYGDWLNIWSELTENKYYAYNKMIGNIKELFQYSYEKEEYRLYIPLKFWFCFNIGMALPVMCMQFSPVLIHITFNEFDKCSLLSPTNYLTVKDDIVLFEEGEEICQFIDGTHIYGEFIYFDIIEKRLYYNKKSKCCFKVPEEMCEESSFEYNNYIIRGIYSCVVPENISPVEICYDIDKIDFKESFLLVDYIYVDRDERTRFLNAKHDYLIQQLYFSGEKTIDDDAKMVKIEFFHPSKLLVWVAQYEYVINLNDHFNYSNKGRSIIAYETILMNSIERLSKRNSNYFELAQVYQFFDQSSDVGINLYSFALFPQESFPSGSCNLTQFDYIDIDMRFHNVNKHNNIKFRAYSLNFNVLKIVNGLAGLVFSR